MLARVKGVAAVGYSRRVLENSDINLMAARTG
jgi:hypothetical protein